MPAAAIPFIVGGLGAAGSVASGIIGSNAAGKAADAQVQAANNAAALQKQAADEALNFNKLQYGNSLNLMSPFYNTGTAALNRLSYLMGISPNQGLPPGVINPNAGASTVSNASFLRPDINTQNPDVLPPVNSGGFRTFNREGSMVPTAGVNPGEFGPPQLTLDPNDPNAAASSFPGNPDAHNFGNAGMIDASTNQGGGAIVPRIDGGGLPGQPTPGGDFGSLSQNFGEQFVAPTDVTEQNDPGYKFRLQQGQDAIQRSAAARGGLLSGGTAKALSDYNQNAASGEYGNVYGRAASEFERRYNIFKQNQADLFNRLSLMAGGGQTTAQQLSSAGQNFGQTAGNILQTSAGQIGQNINNAGAARGSGYVGSANAVTGAIGGVGNSLNNLALLYAMQHNG